MLSNKLLKYATLYAIAISKIDRDISLNRSENIWYHGDLFKRDSFLNQKMDRDRSVDLNENGPGIYFTSEIDEAKNYGDWIHIVKINANKKHLLTDTTKSTAKLINDLIMQCPKEKRDMALTNFGETNALSIAISIYKNLTFADAAISIYHDIFNYNANEWGNAMVSIGFNAYQPSNRPHMIVYNPNIIEVVSAIKKD